MNADAYRTLDELSLPRPRTYELKHILENESSERLFYLRYDTPFASEHAGISRFATAEQLRHSTDRYLNLYRRGLLLQIEDGIISVYGGCVVTAIPGVYVELVAEHLSGLLLHGWLNGRIYASGRTTLRRSYPQRLMVRQSPDGNTIQDSPPIDDAVIGTIAQRAIQMTSRIPEKMFFEFVADDSRLVWFVDVKPYAWHIDFKKLCDGSPTTSTRVYQKAANCHSSPEVYTGPFEIEKLNRLPRGAHVAVNGNALLSHFITRGLRSKIAALLI